MKTRATIAAAIGLSYAIAACAPPAQAESVVIWEHGDGSLNKAFGELWQYGQNEQVEFTGVIACEKGSRKYIAAIVTAVGDHRSVASQNSELGQSGEAGFICGEFHTHPYSKQSWDNMMQVAGGGGPSDADQRLWDAAPGYDHVVVDRWGKFIQTWGRERLVCEWNEARTAMPSCVSSND